MKKIKVSAVSFLNSSPFIYGINHSEIKNEIELSLDIPSVCSDKLLYNKADLGLIPVAEIPALSESYIVSDYCISATGKVNSVLLFSEVPLMEIEMILLDYHSRTSVQLLKILAQHHWKIHPEFYNAGLEYEHSIEGTTAGLVIGDRALLMKHKFKFQYVYDLSEAWFEMTSLPFVFACWVSNKKLPENFLQHFNTALMHGVNHIDEVVAENYNFKLPASEIKQYLTKNISYVLNDDKKKGMELFFSFLKKEKIYQQ
ncbi:MAG: menaquinone biosynthesis protein [Bacteroidota bacterium]